MFNWINLLALIELGGVILWILVCALFISYIGQQAQEKPKRPWARLYDRELH